MSMRNLINIITESYEAEVDECDATNEAEELAAGDEELEEADGEELEERIDGLGALGPLQGYNRSTPAMRHMMDLAAQAANNPTKSPLDTPMTEPQRELIAQTQTSRVGYNMLDVVNSAPIQPEEGRFVNIKV